MQTVPPFISRCLSNSPRRQHRPPPSSLSVRFVALSHLPPQHDVHARQAHAHFLSHFFLSLRLTWPRLYPRPYFFLSSFVPSSSSIYNECTAITNTYDNDDDEVLSLSTLLAQRRRQQSMLKSKEGGWEVRKLFLSLHTIVH